MATPACRRPSAADGSATLTVAGSTSVQPFAEKLAEHYRAEHPGLAINVQGGGSTAGVRAAETGAAQIGMSSRHLKDTEEALHQVTIALDGSAVIVNVANPVAGLTRAQVAAFFAGEVTRWNQVGGPDRQIHFVTREEGSGTHGAFEEIVMAFSAVRPWTTMRPRTSTSSAACANSPATTATGMPNSRARAG